MLELDAHNWDSESYDPATASGHIAVEVNGCLPVRDAVRKLAARSRVGRADEANGTICHRLVEDPDGYKIEFIQKSRSWRSRSRSGANMAEAIVPAVWRWRGWSNRLKQAPRKTNKRRQPSQRKR